MRAANGWWGGPRSALLQEAGSLRALTWTGPQCALCFVLCERLMRGPNFRVGWWDSCGPALGWTRELARIAWTVCAAFSHTWKSVLSLELILGLMRCVESVWNFGYTPRKPLGAVHFTTLKSLLQVLRRYVVSGSLYIDLSFANRMTERQTVQWVPVFCRLLYVLYQWSVTFSPYSSYIIVSHFSLLLKIWETKK